MSSDLRYDLLVDRDLATGTDQGAPGPGAPASTPIGLRVTRAARVVSRAFERAMADAGGSASMWQVLLLVRSQKWGTQSAMAEEMGITGATLTHHLNML